MVSRTRHNLVGIVLGALIAVLGVTTALAEGFFSSYMSNVYPGFSSRTWDDDNTDSTSTWVYFEDCRYGGLTSVNTDIRIRKENSWWPDETVGESNLNCYASDIAYFGDMNAADYHFDIKYVMGTQYPANPLDVLYLDVGW